MLDDRSMQPDSAEAERDRVARDATTFLAKPFTSRELADAVRQLLDRS